MISLWIPDDSFWIPFDSYWFPFKLLLISIDFLLNLSGSDWFLFKYPLDSFWFLLHACWLQVIPFHIDFICAFLIYWFPFWLCDSCWFPFRFLLVASGFLLYEHLWFLVVSIETPCWFPSYIYTHPIYIYIFRLAWPWCMFKISILQVAEWVCAKSYWCSSKFLWLCFLKEFLVTV